MLFTCSLPSRIVARSALSKNANPTFKRRLHHPSKPSKKAKKVVEIGHAMPLVELFSFDRATALWQLECVHKIRILILAVGQGGPVNTEYRSEEPGGLDLG